MLILKKYSIINTEREVISVENQRFNIEIDGVDKVAEVLKVLSIDGKEYVIYSVDNGDDSSDIFTSEIIKDEEDNDMFELIDNEVELAAVEEAYNKIFMEEE